MDAKVHAACGAAFLFFKQHFSKVCVSFKRHYPKGLSKLSNVVKLMLKFTWTGRRRIFSLQPTLPRGICPSTNPSEGFGVRRRRPPGRRGVGGRKPPPSMDGLTRPTEGSADFGRLLAPFWHLLAPFWRPLAALWLPFGSLWHPFGTL